MTQTKSLGDELIAQVTTHPKYRQYVNGLNRVRMNITPSARSDAWTKVAAARDAILADTDISDVTLRYIHGLRSSHLSYRRSPDRVSLDRTVRP